MINEKYIRFDWAAKRMLRDKANFGVLEGLITVLLGEEVNIIELPTSEANEKYDSDQYNRIEIIACNSKDEIILVEISFMRFYNYIEHILYNEAQPITEHIVKKVYSISILYFDLGQGNDYLYHGQTVFTGVHTGDTLRVTAKEKSYIEMKTPQQIFPEYYLIRVNQFNQVATTPLEEWIDYLRNAHIKDDTTTPGLQQAKERLQYMQMSRAEKASYERHLNDVMTQNSTIRGAFKEGKNEGLAEGRAEGERAKALAIASNLRALGLSPEAIAGATGLTPEQAAEL